MTLSMWRGIPSSADLRRWADGIKSASITILALGAASVTCVGIFNAVTNNAVSVDPIKVPAPFEEGGFTSPIATARLLDEIAKLQRQTSSAKERVSVLTDNPEHWQASVGGFDVRQIQAIAQEMLGMKKRSITGEITFQKNGDVILYDVRLRRQPGNEVLLNLTTSGDPGVVLKKSAMVLMEVIDPHIAAAIYYRANDNNNAMRLINVVLNNETTADDKYSLNLRGYIRITEKRLDEAKQDFDRIMKLDSKFAPAYGMAAWLYRAKRDFDLSLSYAEKAIEYAPIRHWGYFQKAQTLILMKRPDEAEKYFHKSIELNPEDVRPYIQVMQFMGSRRKYVEAEAVYGKAASLYPESASLHANYGALLRTQGNRQEALRAFGQALALDPTNKEAIAGRAALETGATRSEEFSSATEVTFE